MKKRLAFAVAILITITSLKVSAQVEKGDVNIGLSGLPIADVFNSYPDNKITGLGVSGQVGFFPHKNLYLGLNPYYVKVKNRYPDSGTMTQEDMKIYGINTALSYYGAISSKFYLYAGVSLGFGVSDDQKHNVARNTHSNITTPIFTVAPGVGIHYFITSTMTLNLNLPWINTKYISYSSNKDFRTIAPMIGLGFFF